MFLAAGRICAAAVGMVRVKPLGGEVLIYYIPNSCGHPSDSHASNTACGPAATTFS